MTRQILYSAADLRSAQENSACVIFDCRFDLKNTDAGFNGYLEAHIPGAVYAHLDDDLSSPVTASSGRHPLPDADQFAAFLARSGWYPGKSVVAYDDAGGSIAARLWWLMKYFEHDCAALLDGGIGAWCDTGFELESGPVGATSVPAVALSSRENLVLSTEDIIEGLANEKIVLADARARERFAGEIEPIDTVAGHIPGSVNYPFSENLTSSGAFKPAEKLRPAIEKLLGNHATQDLVNLCGSGVTACHNIFAAELAGLEGSKLYVGSWSEWIRDPSRPVGTLT